MSISSMTGFATVRGEADSRSWAWELKSVNAKGRDIRCRLPGGFDNLERAVRERAAERIHRGNVSVSLSLVRDQADGGFRVNQQVLDQVLSALADLHQRLPAAGAPSLDGLMALKGVIEPAGDDLSEEAMKALEEALLAGFEEALDALAEMRAAEGDRLARVLGGQIGEIDRLCGAAESAAALQPEAIRHRLAEQVAELLHSAPALPAERLAQEAAVLMTKADVREEVDRLKSHIAAARQLIAAGGAVGRKLDFLCQEFNREANTLCAKSADVELTRLGLDLKAAVEQLREQVQNIE